MDSGAGQWRSCAVTPSESIADGQAARGRGWGWTVAVGVSEGVNGPERPGIEQGPSGLCGGEQCPELWSNVDPVGPRGTDCDPGTVVAGSDEIPGEASILAGFGDDLSDDGREVG